MDGLSWYPRYTGDYSRKTKHLSMLEHGAYTLLLDHYYATGKPLFFSNASGNAELMPDHSRLYRLCSAISKEEQNAVDSVLAMFFEMTPEGYINKKARETIEKQKAAHDRRVNAGRKGGKQKFSNAKSNAKAKPKQPEPEPEPESLSITNVIESPTVYEEAVNLYNEIGLPKVQKVSKTRLSRLKARLKDCGGIEGWKTCLEKVKDSDFLMGRSKPWNADFDFIVTENKFIKIMEGGFDNNNPERNGSHAGNNADAELQRYLDR